MLLTKCLVHIPKNGESVILRNYRNAIRIYVNSLFLNDLCRTQTMSAKLIRHNGKPQNIHWNGTLDVNTYLRQKVFQHILV